MDRLTVERICEYAMQVDAPLDEERATELTEVFADRDEIIESLKALSNTKSPVKRDYWYPDETVDPYGAFLACCAIQSDKSGLLNDLTVGVKDNIAVADVPMTCGSPLLNEYIPAHDATVVRRLLDAGAQIIGKTNMDEFAMGGRSTTLRFRQARNPCNPDRHPGGSSVGSGIAVSEGSVDVALGSDTGGSIRFPAAWCGVVGLKPTRGLISRDGLVQYAKTLDTIGVLSCSVSDAARVLQIIAGPDPRDGSTAAAQVGDYSEVVKQVCGESPDDLTVGVPNQLYDHSNPLDGVICAALDELETAGATICMVDLPDLHHARSAWLAIAMIEFSAYIDAGALNYWLPTDPSPVLSQTFQERSDQLGETVLENWLYGRSLIERSGDIYYALAHQVRRLTTVGINAALDDVDVLACTTVPQLPPKIGADIDDLQDATANTRPFSLTGHPAISVLAGHIDGLPIGLQFIGNAFDEKSILQAAAHWEEIHG